jgi:PKHD-type hydroxylase
MYYHWWLKTETNNSYAYYNNIFNNDEILEILKIGVDDQRSLKDEAKTGSYNLGEGIKDVISRKSEISWIRADIKENQWIFQKLTDIINLINKEFFQFDLDYIQCLQFTKYYQGQFYKSHTDMAHHSERFRKLSFTIQLTDPSEYEGGDVNLYTSYEPIIISKEKGTLTVFPSYILHEVQEIKKGERISLVGWVSGPRFK